MGSSEPFIVPKRIATTPVSLVRDGLDLIFSMRGCFYVYYITNVPDPVTKKYMTASIFITELALLFRESLGGAKEEDIPIKTIWFIYQNSYTKKVSAVCFNKRQDR